MSTLLGKICLADDINLMGGTEKELTRFTKNRAREYGLEMSTLSGVYI